MEQNQLTTEQIARVFVTYYDTPYLFDYTFGDSAANWVNKSSGDTLDAIYREGALNRRLLLTPLPSIGDEHAIEVINLIEPSTTHHSPNIKSLIVYLRGRITDDCRKDYRVYQYLISKGYAVPLFIAPGHPLNGKTAIEIGLAIDSTQSANTPSL